MSLGEQSWIFEMTFTQFLYIQSIVSKNCVTKINELNREKTNMPGLHWLYRGKNVKNDGMELYIDWILKYQYFFFLL